jgi:hypothetical protein
MFDDSNCDGFCMDGVGISALSEALACTFLLIPPTILGLFESTACRTRPAINTKILSLQTLCTRLAGVGTNVQQGSILTSLTRSATGSAVPLPLPLRHSRR